MIHSPLGTRWQTAPLGVRNSNDLNPNQTKSSATSSIVGPVRVFCISLGFYKKMDDLEGHFIARILGLGIQLGDSLQVCVAEPTLIP